MTLAKSAGLPPKWRWSDEVCTAGGLLLNRTEESHLVGRKIRERCKSSTHHEILRAGLDEDETECIGAPTPFTAYIATAICRNYTSMQEVK